MTGKNSVLLSLLLFLCLSLTACFPPVDPRWELEQYGGLAQDSLQTKICTLASIRSDEVQNFRLLGDAQIIDGDGSRNARLSLAASYPEVLRLELLPPNAALSLLLVTAKDKAIRVIKPTEQEYSKVLNAEELFARKFKAKLLASDLAFFLSARIPPRHQKLLCEQKGSKVFGSADNSIITLVNDKEGILYRISQISGLVLQSSIRRNDEWPILSSSVQEEDFPDPELQMPRSIKLVLGNRSFYLELKPTLTKVRQSIPASLFDVAIPPGYKEVEMKW